MNEQKIDELKNALREIMRLVVQRGQPLSVSMRKKLAQVMEFVTNRIEQLRSEEQPEEIEPITPTAQPPELPPGPFESSNVNAFKYSPKTGELFVQFHGPYPQAAGPTYKYSNVPQYIYDVFAKGRVGPKTSGANAYHRWIRGVTPSLGASLAALVKNGGFPYQKIS